MHKFSFLFPNISNLLAPLEIYAVKAGMTLAEKMILYVATMRTKDMSSSPQWVWKRINLGNYLKAETTRSDGFPFALL